MKYLRLFTATCGLRSALGVVVGIAAGLINAGILSAIGLAEFLNEYPEVNVALRYGGGLFMVWLGIDAWREAGNSLKSKNSL